MKKSIILFLSVVLMLCLASCTKDVQESETKPEGTETTIEENKTEEVRDLILDEQQEIKAPNKRYIIQNIRIRTDASTNSEIVGHTEEGEIYEVFESKKDDKYTWYRIGDSKWIADDGGWTSPIKIVKFKSNNGTKEENIQEYAPEMEYRYLDGAVLDSNKFRFPHYVFVGWNTMPDGSGKNVFNNEYVKYVLTDKVDALCLYAQWQPVVNKNIAVIANTNIELFKGPSSKPDFLQATIKDGDCFEIFEQIEYDGKIWNRVSRNLWFTDSERNYSMIDTMPDINTKLGSFDKPVKIVENWGDSFITTYNLKYNGDDLISITKTSSDSDIEVKDGYFRPFIVPGYYYGPSVDNITDGKGNIIKQTVTTENNSFYTIFEYDSNNKLISSETINQYGSEGKMIYEYYDNGLLKCRYSDPSKRNDGYAYGIEFEYNGNLVFGYDIGFFDGKKCEDSYYFYHFFRFDNNGRVIQKCWPQSVQAYWDICDYYYQ